MGKLQAAMVLLDGVSAFDHEQGDTPENAAAVALALNRLVEIDAITATYDDETQDVTVNANDVLGASLSLITLLVRTLAENHHADPDATLNTIRRVASSVLSD